MINLLSKFLGRGKSSTGNAGSRVAGFINALEADLGIDAGQKSAIENALREFMQGKKAAKQVGDKAALMKEKEEFRNAINHILNEDQQQKFGVKFQEYRRMLKS